MKGYVILTCKFHKEDNQWVGICQELGTSDFGSTLDEARDRLAEAITLHLNALEDAGEREQFIKENNIQFYIHKPSKIKVSVVADDGNFVTSCVQPIGELVPA